MIPVLYEVNEKTYLDYGLGEIGFSRAVVTRERNGSYEFYGEYPKNGPMAKLLTEKRKIKADAGYRTKWQTFEIVRVVKSEKETIKVYANHISHATNYMVLKGGSVQNANAEIALMTWASNTMGGPTFTVWSDITAEGSVSFNPEKMENARAGLGGVAGSILDVYGGEYEFDNTHIRLHKQMGRTAPTTIEYGRNLTSVEMDTQIANTVTSILPYASYTPEGANQPVLVVADEAVHGPHVGAYEYPRIKSVNFSDKFNNTVVTKEKLVELADKYIKDNNIGVPATSLKLTYVDLSSTLDYQDFKIMEEVELCDILPIYYYDLGITDEKAKISVVNYDVLREVNESVEVGIIGKPFGQSLISGLQSAVSDIQARTTAIEKLPIFNISADGANKIWYDTPPEGTEHKIGDTWYEKNGQYYIMKTWDGQGWKILIDTEDLDRVKREIERVDTQTQAMEVAIQENEAKAREALEQAGASADLATEAQRLADEAKQAHASLSQDVNEAKADLVQKGLELSQLTENFGVTERKVEELDGAIKQTVSRADYDALTGRVSKAETTIQTQAGELSQRLTRTEVESAITGKGYQTKSQVDSNITSRGYITNAALTPYATTVSVENKVRETADGINRTITEVRGLIPMEVGGRNYLLNSKTEISVVGSNKVISLSQELLDNLNKIKTVTISCDVEGTNVSTNNSRKRFGLSCAVEINGVVNYWEVWQTEDTTKKRISQTFTVPEGKTITKFNSPGLWIQAEGNIKVSNPKLEFGVLPTDWTPAPEDLTSPFESFKNEYDRTAKSVIDNLSTVIQTDSQWYTTINNRLRTAEGNFDTLSRTTMPNLIDAKIAADNQIKDTRNDNQSPQWYWANYPKQTVEELKLSSVIGVLGSTYAMLTTEVHWHDASAGKVKQTAKTDTGTYERQGTGTTWDAWVKTANATDLGRYTPLTTFQTVQTTTELYERILGKTDGDIQTNASRLVMTSDLFRVEVGKYINLANNLVYGATKLPKYISSVATTNHIRRVSWGNRDGVGINYTSEMSGWLGVVFPLTKRFVTQGERFSYRIEISVDTVPSKGGVLIQLIDNTPQANMMYNSTILINKTGNMVATGYIDISRTGELAEYSLRFTLTGPGNIIMHRMIIVEGSSIPENFYDTTDYNSEYTRTNLTMLQDRISLGLFNKAGLVSGAQFGQNGVYIKGSLINLDGTVNINDAFVKKLLVDTASIQTLTAFSARIANLVAINIDASKITTNMITAIEGAFESSAGSVSISRNIISINTGSGTNMILNSSGLHYNDSVNNLIGWVGRSDIHGSVYGRSLNISVAPGKLLALGYAAGVGGTYRSAMIIDGSTGKVSIPNGLFPSVTSSAGIYVTNSSDAVWLVRTDRVSGIVFYNDGRVGIIKNNTIVQNF